jgi:CBS domain-containing protein
MSVSDLMSKDLITLSVDESLDLADEVMELGRIRHLPVTNGGRLVGLVTHRDILGAQASILVRLDQRERKQILARIPVADIMASPVDTVHPTMPLSEAARRMMTKKIGCLVVTDKEQNAVGIITEADFLKWAVQLLDAFEAQLED